MRALTKRFDASQALTSYDGSGLFREGRTRGDKGSVVCSIGGTWTIALVVMGRMVGVFISALRRRSRTLSLSIHALGEKSCSKSSTRCPTLLLGANDHQTPSRPNSTAGEVPKTCLIVHFSQCPSGITYWRSRMIWTTSIVRCWRRPLGRGLKVVECHVGHMALYPSAFLVTRWVDACVVGCLRYLAVSSVCLAFDSMGTGDRTNQMNVMKRPSPLQI